MQNTAVTRTTYRKIATYQGNDILEKLTESEQYELDRRRKNRKRKEDRETEVGAWIGSLLTVCFFIGIVVFYIVGGYAL